MPSLRSLFKSILFSWQNHFVVQFSTLSVLTATFTVVFSILSLSLNLNSVLVSWGDSIKITAYLKDELKSEHVSKIEESLKEISEVKDIRFIDKQEAQRVFTKQMSKYSPDLLRDPEFSNPFPANFEMSLIGKEVFSKIEEIASRVAKVSGVEDVSYGQDWVENYASLISAFSRSAWFVTLVLLVGSAFVVGNSIRTSINARRDEIEILGLVGATQKMIVTPFVADGIVMGLISSSLALLTGYLIFIWGTNLFSSSLGFLAFTTQFYYLSFFWVSLSLMLGAVVGGVSAYFCVLKVGGS